MTALSLSGGAKALGPVSFTLPHAGCWWLAGVSGAGKSLLMESLAGFHAEAQGSIRVNGKEVSHHAPERRSIALMPQRWRLFPHWTVARNLRFAAHLAAPTTETHRLTRETQTSPTLPRPPHPRAQRRRNSTHRPDSDPALTGKVLLLDEPLSAVDSALQSVVLDLLQEESAVNQRICLIAAHRSFPAHPMQGTMNIAEGQLTQST